MKKNDILVFAVWIVILTGIGVATYYGVKSLNSNDAQKQIEKEKSLLPADKEKEKKESTTKRQIQNIINKNKTITQIEKKNNSTSNKTTNNNSTNNSNNNSTSQKTNTDNTNNQTNETNNQTNETNNQQSISNPSNPKTLLSEELEEEVSTLNRYGTIMNKIKVFNVRRYSDNTMSEQLKTIIYEFDKSGYNGNTSILRAEAEQVLNVDYSDYVKVNNLINQYRSAVGRAPLTLDRDLCLAATIRAMERAYAFDVTNIEHMRPNGQVFNTVLDDLGINKGQANGENVTSAQFQTSREVDDVYPAENAVNDWYYSPGHRENFERSEYNVTGVGAYQLGNTKYWVQIFLKR